MLYSVRPEAREQDYPQPKSAPDASCIGRWVYLGCYLPVGLMQEDDAPRYLQSRLGGESIYCCVRCEEPFVVVRNDAKHEFRVNPDRVIWVPKPRYRLHDVVRTKVGTSRIGRICQREWHIKEGRLYYFIDIDGDSGRKRHSRRYWDDELELCQVEDGIS